MHCHISLPSSSLFLLLLLLLQVWSLIFELGEETGDTMYIITNYYCWLALLCVIIISVDIVHCYYWCINKQFMLFLSLPWWIKKGLTHLRPIHRSSALCVCVCTGILWYSLIVYDDVYIIYLYTYIYIHIHTYWLDDMYIYMYINIIVYNSMSTCNIYIRIIIYRY